MEESSWVLPPTLRQEAVHPWETPVAYLNIGGGRGNWPEPSIRNVEVWLDLQAHLMDTPHWWVELTAIPNVEDPRKLAQKIHASFNPSSQMLDLPRPRVHHVPYPQMSHQG